MTITLVLCVCMFVLHLSSLKLIPVGIYITTVLHIRPILVLLFL